MVTEQMISDFKEYLEGVVDYASLADSIEDMKSVYVAEHERLGLPVQFIEDRPAINQLIRLLRRMAAKESSAVLGTPHA